MPTTLNLSDGKVIKFVGCASPVIDEPDESLTENTPQQEVLDPDKLQGSANVIENLPSEESALTMMKKLTLDQAINWFELGGVLNKINKEQWLGPYGSFDELCEQEFGFKKSKAHYLMAIYKKLLVVGLSWKDVEEIGWSKLRLLCSKLSPDQLSTWVESGKAKELTRLEIEADLKGDTSIDTESQVSTLTFKPHDDQLDTIMTALAKAKKMAPTPFDTVALEAICTEFIATGPKVVPKAVGGAVVEAPAITDMTAMFQQCVDRHDGDIDDALKEIFDAFEKVFPAYGVDVYLASEDAP